MLLLCGDKMTVLRTNRRHLQLRKVHLENLQLRLRFPKHHRHDESPIGLHQQ
jgi:hypothetical protein